MTSDVAAAPAETSGARLPRPTRRQLIEWGSLALALVLVGLASRFGAGLDVTWQVAWGIVATVPLLVVTRAWRRPLGLVVIAAALPLGILVVALLQWPLQDLQGSARVARYAWAVLLMLGLGGFAVTPLRRLVVVVLAGLLVVDQFVVGWAPWWAHGTQTYLMWGQFFWHNQFGIYCAVGAALGLTVMGLSTYRPLLLAGAVIASAGVAGTFASGSRADLAILGVIVVVVLVLSARRARIAGAVRVVVGAVIAFGFSCLLFSTVFFPTFQWPWIASFVRETTAQTAEESGDARLGFWIAGIRLGAEHPMFGAGLQQFYRSQSCTATIPWSSNPHNEFVLAWSEGGIIALLPLVILAIAAVWLLVRTARDAWRRPPESRDGLEDAGRWAAVIGMIVLFVHASVDFDWAWPSLLVMTGILAGVGIAPVLERRAMDVAAPSPSRGRVIAVAVLLGLVVVAGFATQLIDPSAAVPLLGVRSVASQVEPCLH